MWWYCHQQFIDSLSSAFLSGSLSQTLCSLFSNIFESTVLAFSRRCRNGIYIGWYFCWINKSFDELPTCFQPELLHQHFRWRDVMWCDDKCCYLVNCRVWLAVWRLVCNVPRLTWLRIRAVCSCFKATEKWFSSWLPTKGTPSFVVGVYS